MDTQLKDGIQREARALLALGWVPAADEPGRLYPLFADVPPVVVQRFVGEVMLDLVEDRRGPRVARYPITDALAPKRRTRKLQDAN